MGNQVCKHCGKALIRPIERKDKDDPCVCYVGNGSTIKQYDRRPTSTPKQTKKKIAKKATASKKKVSKKKK